MATNVTERPPERRPPGYWKREADRLAGELLEARADNAQLRGHVDRLARKGKRGGPPACMAEIFNLTPPEG
jgi:hypothetical protein